MDIPPLSVVVERSASALSVGGAIVNIRKNRWGFVLWTVASIIWIGWGLMTTPIPWGFCLTQLVFLAINVCGFVSWSRGGNMYIVRNLYAGSEDDLEFQTLDTAIDRAIETVSAAARLSQSYDCVVTDGDHRVIQHISVHVFP